MAIVDEFVKYRDGLAAPRHRSGVFCTHSSPTKSRLLAVGRCGSLFIPPVGGTMLLARRRVIRKQDEALAHLQQGNALGRVARLFGGIRAVVCLVQILAPCGHFTFSTAFAVDVTQNEKSRFGGSALELRGEETE
jgi:hypothetical protein